MKLNLKCLKHESERDNVALLASYNDQSAAFNADCKALFEQIEEGISTTDGLGKMPLWDGYVGLKNYGRSVGTSAKRKMSQVRTGRGVCEFYAWLAAKKRPDIVVEFGAAFGASGMYWLAGLEQAGAGMLYSFEPNAVWCDHARRNFETVSPRFVLV